jgi:SAM-dependent methyltransferase
MKIGTFVALVVVLAGCIAAAGQAPQQTHTARPDHMDRHFTNPEVWAREFDDPARDGWQMPARVIEELQLQRGQAVADIGAGTGYFSVRLARSAAAPTVYAVDIEPAMVEYLRRRAAKEGLENMIAVQAGADRANLSAPVDVVLIVNTYHHIGNRETYFRELRKSIKPSGRVAIVDWKKGAPGGPPDEFRFTPAQLRDELGNAGYEFVQQHDFLPNQIFLVFRPASGLERH